MLAEPRIAEIAALVGDPARANMIGALMDGRALSATDLAWFAGVSPQTTSGHLARLTDAGLLAVARSGRHRYYRLSSPLVGRMVEAIMAVAESGPCRRRPAPGPTEALRAGRTCYDHLAGRLGVAIADRLAEGGHVLLGEDGGEVTASGRALLAGIGVDVAALATRRRAFCRPCLDWSERRPHIAGAVGAAIRERCLALGWVAPVKDSRAVTVTPTGRAGLADWVGLTLQ